MPGSTIASEAWPRAATDSIPENTKGDKFKAATIVTIGIRIYRYFQEYTAVCFGKTYAN
jgi:hypothetical protein